MVEGIFDTLSSALISFCITVINLLPESPFSFLTDYGAPAALVMSYVNWFIDFGTIIRMLSAWVACILVWYGYQIVLRWIKVVE